MPYLPHNCVHFNCFFHGIKKNGKHHKSWTFSSINKKTSFHVREKLIEGKQQNTQQNHTSTWLLFGESQNYLRKLGGWEAILHKRQIDDGHIWSIIDIASFLCNHWRRKSNTMLAMKTHWVWYNGINISLDFVVVNVSHTQWIQKCAYCCGIFLAAGILYLMLAGSLLNHRNVNISLVCLMDLVGNITAAMNS